MNKKYYVVDVEGKHLEKDFEELMAAVAYRMDKHLSILEECGSPLNIKLRRIKNEDENVLEIYAFVFSDERGAI